jgi:hypothetical protein
MALSTLSMPTAMMVQMPVLILCITDQVSVHMLAGVAVGGHDLNADPQEMKHRTYYLSNGTIRVAGKLMTR